MQENEKKKIENDKGKIMRRKVQRGKGIQRNEIQIQNDK